MSEPRPTFRVTPLVYIAMRGVPRYDPRHVVCPDDQGLCKRLLVAVDVGELPCYERCFTSGGGQFVYGWRPEDAPKVVAWLSQYADQVED